MNIDNKTWESENGNWCRKCGCCQKVIIHSSSRSCISACKKHRLCRICSKIRKHSESNRKLIADGIIWKDSLSSKWYRKCPCCSQAIGHTTIRVCARGVRQKMACFHCRQTGNKNHRFGTKASSATRKLLSLSRLGTKNHFFGKHHSSDAKRKLSLAAKRRTPEEIEKRIISMNKNRFIRKPYTFPDGKTTIFLQGYEAWTIDYLLSSSLAPQDIKTEHADKPKIKYELSGSSKTYYPDCFLPLSNTIVETKSSWTWTQNMAMNKAKISSSLDYGFNVRVITWDRGHKLVEDTTYTKTVP